MASAEALTWREGSIHVWTGSATASAVVAYAQNMNIVPTVGYVNRQSLAGTYTNHETGRFVQFQIGLVASQHWTLFEMFSSGNEVNMHLKHTGVNGSAGLFLYSGRIDAMPLIGQEGTTFQWAMNGHANVWSSYGG